MKSTIEPSAFGHWALITGASSGIGEGFARRHACLSRAQIQADAGAYPGIIEPENVGQNIKEEQQYIMTRNWVYILTTSLVALMSFVTGIGNLIPFPHIEADLHHLGYPPYFRVILGAWKVIAAIVIAIPQKLWIKDLAYMGILLDLSGAAASRWAVGDGAIKVIVPLIISIWTAISWWNFRMRLSNTS